MSDKVIMPRELTAENGAMEFTQVEVNLIRQWFNFVQDTNPKYLESDDFELYEKIVKPKLKPPVTPERLAEILSRCCYKSRLMEKDSPADFRFEYFKKSITTELLKTLDIREKE